MNGQQAAEHAFAVCAFLEERQLTDVEAFAVLALALGNVLAVVPEKPLTPEQLEASITNLNETVRQHVLLVQQHMQK
jgi:hypothetical protein